jgi:hypothetical protein
MAKFGKVQIYRTKVIVRKPVCVDARPPDRPPDPPPYPIT